MLARYVLYLTPAIGFVDTENDGEIIEHGLGKAVAKRIVTLADLVGSKALRVVKASLGEGYRVQSVAFDLQRREYVVAIKTSIPREDVVEWLRGNYGGKAADTWMEGRIQIAENAELHLRMRKLEV